MHFTHHTRFCPCLLNVCVSRVSKLLALCGKKKEREMHSEQQVIKAITHFPHWFYTSGIYPSWVFIMHWSLSHVFCSVSQDSYCDIIPFPVDSWFIGYSLCSPDFNPLFISLSWCSLFLSFINVGCVVQWEVITSLFNLGPAVFCSCIICLWLDPHLLPVALIISV